jgi:hypothetical protein
LAERSPASKGARISVRSTSRRAFAAASTALAALASAATKYGLRSTKGLSGSLPLPSFAQSSCACSTRAFSSSNASSASARRTSAAASTER